MATGAPVKGDFDGVAWLGFNHPGTAQGILVEARPAWRQDGATGCSQVTTTGSWGKRRKKLFSWQGGMVERGKLINNKPSL